MIFSGQKIAMTTPVLKKGSEMCFYLPEGFQARGWNEKKKRFHGEGQNLVLKAIFSWAASL